MIERQIARKNLQSRSTEEIFGLSSSPFSYHVKKLHRHYWWPWIWRYHAVLLRLAAQVYGDKAMKKRPIIGL